MSFVVENEIYELLEQVGIKCPRFHIAKVDQDLKSSPFNPGEPVVVKGVALDLWHKSDLGLVQFHNYDSEKIRNICNEMPKTLAGKKQYRWQHSLVIEKIDFKKNSQLPSEIFLSLKKDASVGWVLLWGIGGVHSEFWAKEIPPVIINLKITSVSDAFDQISAHFVSQVLLGKIRGGQALTDDAVLEKFIGNIYKLPALLEKKNIELLEVNPFVVSQAGELIPLDGVGVSNLTSEVTINTSQPRPSLEKLFCPKRIGIVGVSSRANSPINVILANAQKSNCEVLDVKDVTELVKAPVDLLIVGVNPQNTFKLIQQLLDNNGGADYLYLVTGGISDGSDHDRLGEKILKLLHERRFKGLWTPTIIGPNGLGLISEPVKLNTLFIPDQKLELKFSKPKEPEKENNLAIISQSGAYLITRLSQMPDLLPKYGISIGGKMDLKVPDLIAMLEQDSQIKTVGLYIEGFDSGEALRAAELMQKSNKNFVIYKGGRSVLGAEAALSHTGAMMTDYGLLQATFNFSNVCLAESFSQWNAQLYWHKTYPKFSKTAPWGFMTNAGYESVGSGDFAKYPQQVLSDIQLASLKLILEKHQLQNLVSANNPLDLTPMASENVWLECVEFFLQTSVETLMLGIVPLTPRLNTKDPVAYNLFIEKISNLAKQYQKNIGVILDVGEAYVNYKVAFLNHEIPVFSSVEAAMRIF